MSAHNGRALAHAAGQLARIAVGELGEADAREERHRLFLKVLFLKAAQLELYEHVVEHCAPFKEHRALEHDPQVRLRTADRVAVDAHRAAARGQQAGDDAKQRGLAAARRPDHRGEFASGELKVDRRERVRDARAAPERLCEQETLT